MELKRLEATKAQDLIKLKIDECISGLRLTVETLPKPILVTTYENAIKKLISFRDGVVEKLSLEELKIVVNKLYGQEEGGEKVQ